MSYFTDFSSVAAGAIPAETTVVGGATTAWGVVADASATGGKVMRATYTSAAIHYLGFSDYTSQRDVDVTVKIRCSSATDGQSGVFFRSVSATHGYLVTLRHDLGQLYFQNFSAGGSAATTGVNFTHSANTWYYLRVQIAQNGLRAKAWADGAAEPATWQLNVAGATGDNVAQPNVGLFHSAGSGVSTDYDTVQFRDFTAATTSTDFSDEPTGSAVVPFGWTRSNTSESWSIVTDAASVGGRVLRAPTAGGTPRILRHDLSNSRNDLDIKVKLRTSVVNSDGGPGIWLGQPQNGTAIRLSSLGVRVQALNNTTEQAYTTFSLTWSANEWVYLRVKKVFGTISVKAWRAADAEPSTWGFSGASIGGTTTRTQNTYDKTPFYNGLLIQDAGTHDFDTIDISYPETTTDFSSDAAGANPPALFTKHANFGPSVPWTVVDDGAGNKFLRNVYNNDSVYNRMLVFEPATNVNDVDITTRIRTNSANMPQIRLGAYNSGSTWPDSTYIEFGETPSKNLRVANIRAGTVVFNDTVAYTWSRNAWFNVRAQKVGRTIKVKVWADGAAEPSTWNYTKTHANIYENRTPFVNGISAATAGTDTQDFDLYGFTQSAPPAVNYSFTQDVPANNTAGAFAPTVNIVNPVNVSIDLSAVPLAGALGDMPNPGFGLGAQVYSDVATASGSAPAPTMAPIDRAYTDFGDQSTNATPSGWTVSGTGTAKVQTSAASGTIVPSVGKLLELSGVTTSGTVLALWDLVGTPPGGSLASRLRVTGDNGPVVQLVLGYSGGNYLSAGVGTNGITLYRVTGGTRTSIGSVSKSVSAGATFFNARAAVQGGRFQARIWASGAAEPSAWDIDIAVTETGDGQVGVYLPAGSGYVNGGWIDTLEYGEPIVAVQATVALRSQVLPLVQKNLGVLWKATKAVDKTRSLLWSFGTETVLDTGISLRWNTVQTVQASTAFRWDTYKETVVSRALRWVFSQEVDSVSRSLRWNVRTAVETRTLDLRWADVQTVDAPTTVSIPWQDQAPVQKTLTTRWVTQSEGRVTLSLRSRWDTLVTIAKNLKTRWSSNLDAFGVIVEDFDDKPLGQLEPAVESRWQPYNWDSDFEHELSPTPTYGEAPTTQGITVVEDPNAFGRRVLRKAGGSPIYYLDEPDPWEHDVVVRFKARDSSGVDFWVGPPNTRHYGFSAHLLRGTFASGGQWTFGRWDAPQGQFNHFIQSSTALIPWSQGEWMWARIQLRHDKINRITQGKAKVWRDGTPEPKSWTLDYTLNGVSGPDQVAPGSRVLGTSNEYLIVNSNMDLDRVSWTTPHTRVVLDAPATANVGALAPAVSLRQSIQAPTGRANIGFPEPKVEIGDQVVVSWFVLEIPAAISVVEAVEVDDLASAEFEMPVPTAATQASHSVEVPSIVLTGIQMPAPAVLGHAGVSLELDAGSPAQVVAPDPIVRVVARATVFTDPATALSEALAPTTSTEFNAQVQAPVSTATFRSPKPDSINGSREVEVDLRSNAGFSMIPVQGVIATLSIQVDNATLAQAQALPADARTGLAVATSPATASTSGLAPTVQTSIRIGVPPAAATFRARDTQFTRTSTRFSVGQTALITADVPDPVVQVFFQRVDAHVAGAAAYGLFQAVAPEFLSTPAEVGDALVLTLGSTVGEVRLSGQRADLSLGSTRGEVSLVDVRDEEKV